MCSGISDNLATAFSTFFTITKVFEEKSMASSSFFHAFWICFGRAIALFLIFTIVCNIYITVLHYVLISTLDKFLLI